MHEPPLTRPWLFDIRLTGTFLPCRILRFLKRTSGIWGNFFYFLRLSWRLKKDTWKQKNPAISLTAEASINLVEHWAEAQIEWHLFDIFCAIWYTCCPPRFHLKSISCRQPWTLHVSALSLGGCIRAAGNLKALLFLCHQSMSSTAKWCIVCMNVCMCVWV